MSSVDIMTFTIGLDNGYSNTPLGDHSYTMELLQHGGGLFGIEWNIEALGVVEYIGLEVEGNKVVTGYDGVFELPPQAITLLERNGFNCEQVK